MEEPSHILSNGTRIKTHSEIDEAKGFLIGRQYLALRKLNQPGIIAGIVGGHGGDVYWVRHDVEEDEVSAYGFWEFELE